MVARRPGNVKSSRQPPVRRTRAVAACSSAGRSARRTSFGYGGSRSSSRATSASASALRPWLISQWPLSLIVRRPSTTRMAGTIAVAYIQRHAADLGQVRQDEEAHDGADQRADRLEGEGAQHQLAAVLAGDALGDHQVRRRIVAAQRQADAEQEHDQPEIGRAPGQPRQEQGEHHHLDHEHAAAAVDVGQAAQRNGADHDAGQRSGADDALFGRRESEVLHDQRQGDAGHEHDQPLEELAGRGEHPDPPLHAGHRNEIRRRAVGPGGRLVDVALDGARRLGHVMALIEEQKRTAREET